MTEERINQARSRMEHDPNFSHMVERLLGVMEDYRFVEGHNSAMYEEWYHEAVALAETLHVEYEGKRDISAAVTFAEQA